MAAIVYDTGALLAAERHSPDFLALHDEVTAARIRPLVPVVVLAQAWRGGPQHQISRVLKGCDALPDAGAPARRRPRLRRLAYRRRRGYHRHHHRRPPPGSRCHRRPRRPHPHRRLHRRQNPDLRNLTGTQSRLTGDGMWTTASGLGHPATPATDSAGADCAF